MLEGVSHRTRIYVRRSRNNNNDRSGVSRNIKDSRASDFLDIAEKDWVESIKPWMNGNRMCIRYSVVDRRIWLESASEVWWEVAAAGRHLTKEDGAEEALSRRIRKKIRKKKSKWRRDGPKRNVKRGVGLCE